MSDHDSFKPDPQRTERLKAPVQSILENLGENPEREGLARTPERVAKSLQFLTSGYKADIDGIIGTGIFNSDASDMVLIRDIELYSLCEHHMLPFHGKAHVAYIPNGKIIGLSKIPRIINAFSRRLQVQERLTHQVSETLQEVLNPLGVAVIIEAYHLCVMMRGVAKQNSQTITSSMKGEFETNAQTRSEFLQLVRGAKG